METEVKIRITKDKTKEIIEILKNHAESYYAMNLKLKEDFYYENLNSDMMIRQRIIHTL